MTITTTHKQKGKLIQVIKTIEQVPAPFFGHGPQFRPNPGSQWSTHYADGTEITQPKVVKTKTVIHKKTV